MSKIKSVYNNGIDKVWYDSSNIIYSECDDVLNSLKTLILVFKNGRAYKYFDVNVNDYLLFRESESQGKAFTKLIKPYKFEKINDYDVNLIKSSLEEILNQDEELNKEKLFNSIENISNDILKLTNDFKKCNLSDNELSYISYFVNKIIKDLSLFNFTNREINLLEITDKVDAILNELKEKNKGLIDDLSTNKIIKEKLLN